MTVNSDCQLSPLDDPPEPGMSEKIKREPDVENPWENATWKNTNQEPVSPEIAEPLTLTGMSHFKQLLSAVLISYG